MLGQFASEFLALYPGANILVATKDDFEKLKRKTLMSRIATGNWDAVIVTHSSFEKIPVA
jgi:N12 class adenine-specific DNA methylase